MDKIKINNQVVVMRKFVKQGKIRIINKFVKEIQLLRNRKGKEQKIAKSQRKADRLLEEVAMLKKIKPDRVSRLALSKSKDWKAVLSQKNASQEDRCYALLASYGPVQEEVEKFYSENYYLTPKIPALIQEWEEKNSLTPQKNQNSFKAKSKSTDITKSNPSNPSKEDKLIKVNLGKQSLEPKRLSTTEKVDDSFLKVKDSEDIMCSDSRDHGNKNIRDGHVELSNRSQDESDNDMDESESDEGNSDDNQDSYDNEGNSDDNEESNNEENSNDNEENSKDSEDGNESDLHYEDDKKDEGNTCQHDLKNRNKASSNKESKIKSNTVNKYSPTKSLIKSANDFKNKIPSLQKNIPLDSDSTKAVALVNLNELMDMDEIPIVSSKAEEKPDSKSKKRKKDSFFLKDGIEEFSESDQSDEDSNENDRTFSHKNVHGDRFNKKSSFPPHDRMKMEENSNNFRNQGFSKGKMIKRGDHKFRDRDNFHSKQKFNKFVKNDSKPYSDQQNFKKNKWNSDNESNRTGSKAFSNFHEKNKTFNKNKPDNHPRNNFGKTAKKDEPPLHPSWEAKRKMKQATNTKFQGKRIVFDN